MRIWISNRQRKTAISPSKIRKKAGKILNALGRSEAELSLTLLGDRAMARLNRETFGRRGPTNVIAFPVDVEQPPPPVSQVPTGETPVPPPPPLLGEVVISLEATRRQAIEFGWPWQELFDFFLIHGILHLMGYDHDSPQAEEEMTSKTWELMKLLHPKLSALSGQPSA
jgi:probable rRNA maturation factor